MSSYCSLTTFLAENMSDFYAFTAMNDVTQLSTSYQLKGPACVETENRA